MVTWGKNLMNDNKFDAGQMIAGIIEYKYYLLFIRYNKQYGFYIYANPEFNWS